MTDLKIPSEKELEQMRANADKAIKRMLQKRATKR